MLKLFSGTAHPHLTSEIVKLLNLPISQSEVVRFGNSEVKVTIQDDVRNDICVVVQPTSNPTDTHFMELCFFCDALRRQEAKKVVGVIPYFGYAKQNIQHRNGECVSVNVIIRMLESIGFHKIYTFDLHDEATGGVFTIPFKNITAFPYLAKSVKAYFQKNNIDMKNVALVSPDQGALEKVRIFGTAFFGTSSFEEVVIEKKRDQNIAHKAKPLGLYGNVKGKIAIIVDDMVVSGSTLLPAVDLCLERGAVQVYTAAIHHDFTENAANLLQSSHLEKFFTTNTIVLKPENKFNKLHEISIASVIADELKYFKDY
ncbi:ribose-phosphate pyrophosphokinase [Candidatus Roizmanbacteria bacterium]|nr:ribose-phosphate pyrophosphokinase [Candidatus Roizmanbacteria bacterium]